MEGKKKRKERTQQELMDLESVCVKEKERKGKKETADFASQAAAAAARLFHSSFLPLHRFVCYVLVILLLHLLLCAMQRRWRFLCATPTAAAAAAVSSYSQHGKREL